MANFKANVPDFNNYLVYIFANMKDKDPELRQAAGLILKNNIRTSFSHIPEVSLTHIKQVVVNALSDPVIYIRNTAGSLVTSIVTHIQLELWPDLINRLVALMDSKDNLFAVQGAVDAVLKIAEDSPEQLIYDDTKPLDVLIPKLIMFMGHSDETVRKNALIALIQFLPNETIPNALLLHMDNFLKGLFHLATSDPNKRVKRFVCRAFVVMLDNPKFLSPYIKDIIQFMIVCTNDSDEELALEACEFWSMIAESDSCSQFMSDIQKVLPALIPVLLKCMIYAQSDRIMLEEESSMPDRDSDISPSNFFVRPKSHHGGESIDEDKDEEDEDDEEFDDFAQGHDWNLRKCAASSLDTFSMCFGDAILPILLPLIQEKMLPNQPWEVRESVILALGAVAEGCSSGMSAHLAGLVPYLVSVMNDPKPLVRSITCWTLSRYSGWVVEQANTCLQPVLVSLLQKMLDVNKRVQEAACSAFATLEERACLLLVPYLGIVLDTISQAFQIYQKKNVFVLYDAIRALTDSVGDKLNNPEYISKLMPPLIQKWNKLDDGDKCLFPLLECLTGVAGALRTGFQQFAPPVFKRCLTLIEKTYVQIDYALANDLEFPEIDFIVCSLDLVSGIIEGLGPNVESLVADSNLLSLLFRCMQDQTEDIRQSAFGLVGDLARTCIGHLRPVLANYIAVLTKNVAPAPAFVSNNATWALGEIAVQVGPDMKPFAADIMNNILPIIQDPDNNIRLLENIAITIGRLGLVAPEIVAPGLATFGKNWFLSLRRIRNEVEREHTYRGLCVLIRTNPHGVFETFALVCDAIVAYPDPSREMKEEFQKIFNGFKQALHEQAWVAFINSLPADLKQKLQALYQV